MKNVVITGSSRGIGFELAKLFNKNNFNVIALSRNYSINNDLQFKNVKSFYLDISSTKSIFEAVTSISKEFKKVDILINNAGV